MSVGARPHPKTPLSRPGKERGEPDREIEGIRRHRETDYSKTNSKKINPIQSAAGPTSSKGPEGTETRVAKIGAFLNRVPIWNPGREGMWEEVQISRCGF